VALVCPCSRKRLLCVLVAEAACQSYEEEDTCQSYEEEDTCQSYEEEDTCQSYLVAKAAVVKWSSFYIIRVRRRIHVSHTL
jgi:hypothetical protein